MSKKIAFRGLWYGFIVLLLLGAGYLIVSTTVWRDEIKQSSSVVSANVTLTSLNRVVLTGSVSASVTSDFQFDLVMDDQLVKASQDPVTKKYFIPTRIVHEIVVTDFLNSDRLSYIGNGEVKTIYSINVKILTSAVFAGIGVFLGWIALGMSHAYFEDQDSIEFKKNRPKSR